MRDKVITNRHFDYANEIIKILGFKSMCDFESELCYSSLKENQQFICDRVTETMDTFKTLFPLNEFDLRKIKYKFENIDQVIGFFKKLAYFLSIPYETTRNSNNVLLRLSRSKNHLYNIYIEEMEKREIPQYTPVKKEESRILNMVTIKESVKSSEVLKYKKVKSVEQEFIVRKTVELSMFRDIKWINWVKIAMFSNGNVHSLPSLNTTVELCISGYLVSKYVIDRTTVYDENGFFMVPVDFFNNHFYVYHSARIDIKFNGETQSDWMYKIIVNGNDFVEKTPKSYLDMPSIECDHDEKYYVENVNSETKYLWRIMHGMASPSHCERPDLTKMVESSAIQKKFDEYKTEGNVSMTDGILFLKKDKEDRIGSTLYLKYLLREKMLDEYKQFGVLDYFSLKCSYIEQHGETVTIHYPLDELNDIRKSFPTYRIRYASVKVESELVKKGDYTFEENVMIGNRVADYCYIKLTVASEHMYELMEIVVSFEFYWKIDDNREKNVYEPSNMYVL